MEHKQIAITEFGNADVLAIQTAATPTPLAGEVLVKVAYSGVNPIDVKTRAGLGWAATQNKNNLPWVPGYDIAGHVVLCGKGTSRFSEGDKVAGFIGFPVRGGGYSQYVCVPESELSHVPDSVTLEAAAALPLAGQTANQALNKANVTESDRVLILAGAGGVGHIAVQIAIATKAKVFTTSSERNLHYLAALGAHAVNYQFSPVSESVEDVDVLIDLVGGDTAIDALKCLTANARVITVPTITAQQVCEQAKLLGFEASGMLVEPEREQLDALLHMVGDGALKMEIQRVYPMYEMIKAHEQVGSGRTRGKILLDMTC
ncbi:NADP-dependent oxidoreductase [Vibrio sp. AND4]|uniref:NADP-dependent oxidoreductase n=1 Tax=Vibrio sp. AND4 TaxID=314289 RepID=UPI00015F390A|nr:NADP-dependent oxidoreductase [Vibrio sp. AND4]EDP57269.1 quinone oxidoreductase [Vibrio sp. AND4]